MIIKISSFKDENLKENEVEILIKSPVISEDLNKLIDHINKFENSLKRKFLLNSNNVITEISYADIICFYSDKKYNYCRTKEKSYKIKSKLYEVEKLDPNFIRISKACIVNSKQIKCFDLSETGQIVVVLNDGTKEFVSRRKVKDIMEFLDERSIWYEKVY